MYLFYEMFCGFSRQDKISTLVILDSPDNTSQSLHSHTYTGVQSVHALSWTVQALEQGLCHFKLYVDALSGETSWNTIQP